MSAQPEQQQAPPPRMQVREPMDFAEAVHQMRLATEAQHNAERYLARCSKEVADAERLYREELAKEIVKCRASGPATGAGDLARGAPHIAQLKWDREVKEGIREAAAQSIWRHTADRRDLEQFIDWSKRASFLDATASDPARFASFQPGGGGR